MYYCVIYLSPGRYHRFNAPVRHTVLARRHIPGHLKLVRPSYVTKNKQVFHNSERVNCFGQFFGNKHFFMQSYVGATNVGSVKLNYDTDLSMNNIFNAKPYYNDQDFTEEKG